MQINVLQRIDYHFYAIVASKLLLNLGIFMFPSLAEQASPEKIFNVTFLMNHSVFRHQDAAALPARSAASYPQ